MSSLLALFALLLALLPAPLLSQRFVAFTKYQDLVLGSPGLNAGSHVTTHQVKTIWIQEQPFTLYTDAWRWIYDIENIVTRDAYAADLVAQKIRSLDALAKSVKEFPICSRKTLYTWA